MIFFDSGSVDVFLDSVYKTFTPSNKDTKFQGHVEIVNQQRGDQLILEDKRVWLTNIFISRHFNDFVRGEIRDEITKMIIADGQTGSSWYFKRFQRLTVIVVSLVGFFKLLSN